MPDTAKLLQTFDDRQVRELLANLAERALDLGQQAKLDALIRQAGLSFFATRPLAGARVALARAEGLTGRARSEALGQLSLEVNNEVLTAADRDRVQALQIVVEAILRFNPIKVFLLLALPFLVAAPVTALFAAGWRSGVMQVERAVAERVGQDVEDFLANLGGRHAWVIGSMPFMRSSSDSSPGSDRAPRSGPGSCPA